jgi:hypothetical protein
MNKLAGILGIAIVCGCSNTTEPRTDAPSGPRWASLGRVCDVNDPAQSLSAAARDSLPPDLSPESSPNVRWAELARRVPGGWGGFFAEDGVPTIFLVDTTLREEALAVLATEPFLPVTPDTRVKQGRWDFAQLYEWYRYLGPHIWPLEGWRSSDVDEAHNRLLYGVADEAARARAEQRLAALGVPCFLVAIQIRPPMVSL